MMELSELNDFVRKLNDEITTRICENMRNLHIGSDEFIKSVSYFHNKHMVLETTGQHPCIKFSGIVVWCAKMDGNVLDFDDLLRSRLDFICNILYNMDFIGSSLIYCKEKDESEFYLT